MKRTATNPKLKASLKGTGPHLLCYGCDVFVDTKQHEEIEAEGRCVGSGDYVGKCQPNFCSKCLGRWTE